MDSLASIITKLLNEIFDRTVSLEDLVLHLKEEAGRDLENAPTQMILNAAEDLQNPPKDWNDPYEFGINWKEIHFGCEETLTGCFSRQSRTHQTNHNSNFDDNLDMCMYLFCAGLLSEACRKTEGKGELCNLNFILAPFSYYLDRSDLFLIENNIDSLLRFIFKP